MPSLTAIRDRFPALGGSLAFLENAGGSQVPAEVAGAIRDYMLTSYVQLGAGYALSDRATATVDDAHALVATLLNGDRAGAVVLGPSSTQLCFLLADCYARAWADRWRTGGEIVVAESGHEANINPWLRLERSGATIRWWKVDPEAGDCTLDGLDRVLTDRTCLVAFPHVSNLLGGILDVREATRRAHAAGARVIVDGVAYAPHRTMDVRGWDVDWYVYSTYKVYGPHMGALYGRADAIAELDGPNHFFIPRDRVPYVFELGGASHEGCAGLLALGPYLSFLADRSGRPDRSAIERAFAVMTELELPLQQRLIEGLTAIPDVRLVGSGETDAGRRVPTVSFLHRRHRPTEVVRGLHAAGVACRNGHMYSYRLCRALGIPTEEGVVRLSAVHYNTAEEIDRALAAVERL